MIEVVEVYVSVSFLCVRCAGNKEHGIGCPEGGEWRPE